MIGIENTGHQEEGPADLPPVGHGSKLRLCKVTEKQECINSLEAYSVLRSTSLLMHKAPRTLRSTEQSGSAEILRAAPAQG